MVHNVDRKPAKYEAEKVGLGLRQAKSQSVKKQL